MSNSSINYQKSNEQISLFAPKAPLAYRIRPSVIEDVIGQDHLIANSGVLKSWIDKKIPYSIVLWGPPGCGKTSIAFLARDASKYDFMYVAGASTSVSELREAIKRSRSHSGRVILFIDEIHRLAKNQQDVLLEPIEKGEIILIGTTTDNPLISITRALYSRVKVLELKPLDESSLKQIIKRALSNPQGFPDLKITEEAVTLIAKSSSGDVRRLLYSLEEIAIGVIDSKSTVIDKSIVEQFLENSQLQLGVDSNNYYDYVSALQKSIRGSDADAAIYWLARLLGGGADPLMVARRILVCASEDIGLANNSCLQVSLNAYQAVSYLGMPEARIPLAHAVVYLSKALKSNSAYLAIDKALDDVKNLTPYQVPVQIRNLGGLGYKYPHSYEGSQIEQEYMPKELLNKKYYINNPNDNL